MDEFGEEGFTLPEVSALPDLSDLRRLARWVCSPTFDRALDGMADIEHRAVTVYRMFGDLIGSPVSDETYDRLTALVGELEEACEHTAGHTTEVEEVLERLPGWISGLPHALSTLSRRLRQL
ncbi:hypothetical protein [Lentzea sp. E54]|uniref:hypothetical protein n=1 Tax=Lentzea xerophila TaxID=3435883 RepID=UPI003DA640DE